MNLPSDRLIQLMKKCQEKHFELGNSEPIVKLLRKYQAQNIKSLPKESYDAFESDLDNIPAIEVRNSALLIYKDFSEERVRNVPNGVTKITKAYFYGVDGSKPEGMRIFIFSEELSKANGIRMFKEI
jgi:hypothetical protein